MNGSSRLEFEAVDRENVRQVTAFFARRCRDPQQVADLTSQTFVEAIKSAGTYQGRGTPTAWLIAIARRVYADHLTEQATGGASNAFAGWTPQPTAPTAAQLAAAEAYCATNVPTPGLPLKLTEARGPFTFLVYSDGTSNDGGPGGG